MDKILENTIRDWVDKNKKIFWKYEVSCFFQSYRLSIGNLPNPSSGDVSVSAHNHLLNDKQKTQLCGAIKKACTKAGAVRSPNIDLKIDYVNGAVKTAVQE